MKHSSSGLMTETCEPKVVIPSTRHWNSILKSLYVDLFNLIVESRIPGINERGYGDGCHCPPLMGPNVHLCDLMKPECQKHQRMIHHLLRAVRHNVFEIDVLMLPDCCSESNLSERIQNKEYILLERWSMKCMQRCKSLTTVEIPELLRAVRSFLHFSQISAWFSLTKGKSPANIYYWVKPTLSSSLANFEVNPEVHSFPVCKVTDGLYGIVRVNYPARKEFIPIIPCSKHPPQDSLYRTKANSHDLNKNLPLNSQIVRQLQKTCDSQLSIITAKHCATDSESLNIRNTSSEPVLKKLSLSNVKKNNRVLKHSNAFVSQNTSNIIYNSSSSAHLSKNNDKNSHSEISLLNNYNANSSQKNLCFSKKAFNLSSSRKEYKINLLNNVLLPPFCEMNSLPNEIAHEYLMEKSIKKRCDQSSQLPDSEKCKISDALIVQKGETSHNVSTSLCDCHSLSELHKKRDKSLKSFKRKQNEDNILIIPSKKRKIRSEEKTESKTECLKKQFPSQNIIYQSSLKRKHNQSEIDTKKSKILPGKFIQGESDSFTVENFKEKFRKSSTSSEQSKKITKEEIIGECSKSKRRKCEINMIHKKSKERSKINSDSKLTLADSFEQNICSLKVNNENFSLKNYFSNNCDCIISKTNSAKGDSSKNFNSISHKLDTSITFLLEKYNPEAHLLKKYSAKEGAIIESKEKLHSDNNEISQYSYKHTIINTLFEDKNTKTISKIFPQTKKIQMNSNNSYKSKRKLVSKATLRTIRRKYQTHALQNLNGNIESGTSEMLKMNNLKFPFASTAFVRSFNLKKFLNDKAFEEHNKTEIQDSNREFSNDEFEKDNLFKAQNIKHNQIFNEKDYALLLATNEVPTTRKSVLSGNVHSSPSFSKVLPQNATSYDDSFPRHKLKFAGGRKLIGSLEESILKGCLHPVNSVKGFRAEIGASGSFCPSHITLPADVSFYDLDCLNSSASPYMAHVNLGDLEYYLPKKGAVQVTLFNPSETVVKVFVLNYDLSDMPPMCHTFIRQKTYYMPIGSKEECPKSTKWLRFVIHLRFASSRAGKVFLHKDFKIIVLNKSNDDAASEFSQEPRELRSFLHVPLNPTFSNL